jgi:type I restriction enzyme, S subunit
MNNAQVPEGYKQTEAGLIPEDWDVKYLKNTLKNNPQYGINAAAVPNRDNLPIYIRITDISEEGYFAPETLVSVNKENSDQYYLEKGDLVFARTGASVGKSYLYNPNDGELVFAGFLIRIRPDENILLPDYLSQYVKTKAYWNWVQVMSMRSGQPGINGNEYGQLLIPLPETEEQQTIAQALSDVDALIASLAKLIAKQRHLKTAAMQQLLTGKMRLPGFGEGKGYKQTEVGVIPEDWDVRCLGEVGQSLIGLTYKPEDTRDYGTLVLRSSNVQNDRLAYENNVYVDSTLPLPSRVIVEEGDILICVRNGSKQLIGKCALINAEAAGSAFGAFMSVFRTKISGFVFYQFQSDVIQTQINEIMGATINQITNKDMAAFQIPLPPSDEEQRAIATVLSDMDTAIAALETRRAKTQAIKQGMMQELLTGRTRLI